MRKKVVRFSSAKVEKKSVISKKALDIWAKRMSSCHLEKVENSPNCILFDENNNPFMELTWF